MAKWILLNPGPVNVSSRVEQALLRGNLCHREEEFSQLLHSIRSKLLRAFAPHGGYAAVVLTGSGTLALEAAISSSLEEGKKFLVINNGVYGERIAAIARIYGLRVLEVRFSWTERPQTEAIEKTLCQHADVGVIAMVHHETTTGLINPVNEVGRLARQYRCTLVVDSISGLGGEEIDVEVDGVDVCVGTASKCIQGIPGVSFVLIREEVLAAMGGYPRRSLYMHLPAYLAKNQEESIPFTPAVQAYYALEEALQELLEEGVRERIDRYGRAAAFLRDGFRKLGLSFVLPPSDCSHSLTALYLPSGMSYRWLHDRLKEKGFIIYQGQGRLQTHIFRVANMGHLAMEDFGQFLVALAEVLGTTG